MTAKQVGHAHKQIC